MEYLEGEPLSRRLKQGPLPLDEALSYAVQVAGALDVAHRQGVIHRDLKPANVVLTRSGAMLLDFGLAKLISPPGSVAATPDRTAATAGPAGYATRPGLLPGTLHYMSPEQAQGQAVDARSDVFSLGATLFEMLAGRRPPVAPAADTLAPVPLGTTRDYDHEKPASDEVFAAHRSLYAYDRAPLDARVERTDDSSPHWRHETVSFEAAYGGERVIAQLCLPKEKPPPHQVVVYSPAGSALVLRSSEHVGFPRLHVSGQERTGRAPSRLQGDLRATHPAGSRRTQRVP